MRARGGAWAGLKWFYKGYHFQTSLAALLDAGAAGEHMNYPFIPRVDTPKNKENLRGGYLSSLILKNRQAYRMAIRKIGVQPVSDVKMVGFEVLNHARGGI